MRTLSFLEGLGAFTCSLPFSLWMAFLAFLFRFIKDFRGDYYITLAKINIKPIARSTSIEAPEVFHADVVQASIIAFEKIPWQFEGVVLPDLEEADSIYEEE